MSATKRETTDAEATAEETVLTDVLGGHAKTRILVAMLEKNNRDLNATQIARFAGIDPSTFYEHITDLLAYDLVVETRQVGNSTMYRINRDSAAAEALATMAWELLDNAPTPDG